MSSKCWPGVWRVPQTAVQAGHARCLDSGATFLPRCHRELLRFPKQSPMFTGWHVVLRPWSLAVSPAVAAPGMGIGRNVCVGAIKMSNVKLPLSKTQSIIPALTQLRAGGRLTLRHWLLVWVVC